MPKRKKKVNPTAPCQRCGAMCENPSYGSGRISTPEGMKESDKLVICNDCMAIGMTDNKKFWDKGWGKK